MSRLDAHADTSLWVPVTGSFGFRGRRHRKAAIRMLLTQANSAMGATERPGSSVAAWAASQAAPLLMRRMAGRMLVWVWKADPELGVVIAQLQEATPQVRAARAMMPMEYDDTEDFRSPHLGTGEKLELPFGAPNPMDPERRGSPTATYTWDTGTHLVTVSAMSPDRERFGIFVSSVDDLVRTLRVVDDLPAGETPGTLRIDPA
ncbi:hypothetical protein [Microbacterium aurantiacum]|uniref:hypothetical protein n=1 Tax=Microbacterium aurantiacum TaxID=162393 RepID=UPI001F157DEE|nr:hypothetical protein [Microbacterium aurantiacum]